MSIGKIAFVSRHLFPRDFPL